MKTPETEATEDGQPSGLAVAPCSASGISDAELLQTLHAVMLDEELDNLGAPKEYKGGKLSPYGRLRRIAPQLRHIDKIEMALAKAAGRIAADVCADRCAHDDPRVGKLAKLFLGIMREEIDGPNPKMSHAPEKL